MGKVVLSYSMSLDGFVAGPDVSVDLPMGRGGERLHEWLFNEEPGVDAEVARNSSAAVGAVLVGKRTYDVGLQFWNDTPYPAPSFVITHEDRATQVMTSGTFTFVTDGVEHAVHLARAAAREKNVLVMGANVAQQCLHAGLVDEIQIQLVPVLLGAGVRLFDHIGADRINLRASRVIESPSVTHLNFQIAR